MPIDLSTLSDEQLAAYRDLIAARQYNPETALAGAGNPAPAGQAPGVEMDPNQAIPQRSFAPGDSMNLGEGRAFLSLPKKQQKDTIKDVILGTAGNAVGESFASPLLSSGSRFINTLLGAGKGVLLNEGLSRGGAAWKGDPQPDALDPGQMIGDAVSGGLGGLGGYFSAPKSATAPVERPGVRQAYDDAVAKYQQNLEKFKGDKDLYDQAQKAFEDWKLKHADLANQHSQSLLDSNMAKQEVSRLGRNASEQEASINAADKEAQNSYQQEFRARQGSFRTAIKQQQAGIDDQRNSVINLQDKLDELNRVNVTDAKNTTGRTITNIEDEMLKLQDENDALRGNKFEPDPKKLSAFKEKIKKERTDEMRLSGGAKLGAARRRIEAETALDDYLAPLNQSEEENAAKLVENHSRLRELRTMKGQVGSGRSDAVLGDSDINSGKQLVQTQKALEAAQKDYQQRKSDLNQLRISQSQHAEGAGGPGAKSEVDALNAAEDRLSQAREKAYELYRKQQQLRHEKDVFGRDKPDVPKEPKEPKPPVAPSDKDIFLDNVLGVGGRAVKAGGIPAALTAFALHKAGLPPSVSGPSGLAVAAAIGKISGSPAGRAALAQAPRAIPAVNPAVKIGKNEIRKLLGLE